MAVSVVYGKSWAGREMARRPVVVSFSTNKKIQPKSADEEDLVAKQQPLIAPNPTSSCLLRPGA